MSGDVTRNGLAVRKLRSTAGSAPRSGPSVRRRFAAYILLGLAPCCAGAQSSSSKHFTFSKRAVDVVDRLEVRLDRVSAHSDWAVGISSKGSTDCWVNVLSAQFSDASSTGRRRRSLTSLGDWPAEDVRIEAGRVTVSYSNAPPGALIIYGEVPPNTKVAVVVEGRTVLEAIPSPTVALANGTAIRLAEGGGLASLLMHLTHGSVPDPPDVVAMADGTYIASQKALRSHILAFRLPANDPGSATCRCSRMAVFEIFVDQTGKVTRVRRVGGEASLASTSEAEIREWRFRPFQYQGVAVPVRSAVVLRSDEQGNIRWH